MLKHLSSKPIIFMQSQQRTNTVDSKKFLADFKFIHHICTNQNIIWSALIMISKKLCDLQKFLFYLSVLTWRWRKIDSLSINISEFISAVKILEFSLKHHPKLLFYAYTNYSVIITVPSCLCAFYLHNSNARDHNIELKPTMILLCWKYSETNILLCQV